MVRSADCLHCGTERTDKKAGYCRDCMELFLAIDRLSVRRQNTAWRKRVYPADGGGNPVVPVWNEEKKVSDDR